MSRSRHEVHKGEVDGLALPFALADCLLDALNKAVARRDRAQPAQVRAQLLLAPAVERTRGVTEGEGCVKGRSAEKRSVEDDVKLIQRKYNYSRAKAEAVYPLFSSEEVSKLRKSMDIGGFQK